MQDIVTGIVIIARRISPGVAAALLVLLGACAGTTPFQRLDQQAQRLGLTRLLLVGGEFQLVSYRNHVRGDTLHVYLDGDGTPWLNRFAVARDPTPRNPLVLTLMAADPSPSLYLGRPCYHGLYDSPGCHPVLWTHRRYGEQVVSGMAAALARWVSRAGYNDLVFVGYSGGGTLAMLLAERFEQTRALVTIAGNLDPARWAARHGYSPLTGSLNPANRPPLPAAIWQRHYVGGRDNNIAMPLVRSVVAQQHCARLIVMESFNHRCCWRATWPDILKTLRHGLKFSSARTDC